MDFSFVKQIICLFHIHNFRTFIRTQFEREVKNIQCDNGKEFDNKPFMAVQKQFEEMCLFKISSEILLLVIDYRILVIDYTIIFWRVMTFQRIFCSLFAGNWLLKLCNRLHNSKLKFQNFEKPCAFCLW